MGLRLFLSSFEFMLTIAAGVTAFVMAAIHAPTELKQLIDMANVALTQFLTAYVEDRYSVLIGFVFDGKNVVLMGFIIAARLIFTLLMAILFPFSGAERRPAESMADDSRSSRPSFFARWGR